ncbi:Uncharacterized protein APZ42_030982 [Daphnia magna]|uniref:Uncharacterized protein n=1 Tax=Daphnia magna TaxID=35525 RepID=A0A164N884_9CRUS|nr:Uncharacterized protein APZ42_030982 [Daphnia magna]
MDFSRVSVCWHSKLFEKILRLFSRPSRGSTCCFSSVRRASCFFFLFYT